MSVTVNFSPEIERRLLEQAARSGQSVEGFIEQLVEREVLGTNGNQGEPTPSSPAATPSKLALPSDAALASFRREVEESGLTDDELRAFFEEVREEIYQEKHGRPSQAS